MWITQGKCKSKVLIVYIYTYIRILIIGSCDQMIRHVSSDSIYMYISLYSV